MSPPRRPQLHSPFPNLPISNLRQELEEALAEPRTSAAQLNSTLHRRDRGTLAFCIELF